jgi:hypothetical protein
MSPSCPHRGLRQDSRRLPQPHRAALRQPLRPWARAARRLPARSGAGAGWRLLAGLARRCAEADQAATWLWDAPSVRAAFEGTGTSPREQAQEIGLVGPAARACGLVRDVRYDHPAGWHRFAQAPVAVWPTGDVFARARVRGLRSSARENFCEDPARLGPEGASRGLGTPCARYPGRRAGRGLARRGLPCRADGMLTGASAATRSSTRRSTTGPGWRSPCAAGHLGFPPLQQELQPLLLRLRSLTSMFALDTSSIGRGAVARPCRFPTARHRRCPTGTAERSDVEAAKCAEGCRLPARVSDRGDHARTGSASRRARLGPLSLLRRVRRGLPDEGDHPHPRPPHGRAPAGGPAARAAGRGDRCAWRPHSMATAEAVRPVAAAAAGQRRRLQRVRGRHECARHHRLGPGAVRHPVCRLAAPRRRPAHHRTREPRAWSWRCARPGTPCRHPSW